MVQALLSRLSLVDFLNPFPKMQCSMTKGQFPGFRVRMKALTPMPQIYGYGRDKYHNIFYDPVGDFQFLTNTQFKFQRMSRQIFDGVSLPVICCSYSDQCVG